MKTRSGIGESVEAPRRLAGDHVDVTRLELAEVLLEEGQTLRIALDGVDLAVGKQVVGLDADRTGAGADIP